MEINGTINVKGLGSNTGIDKNINADKAVRVKTEDKDNYALKANGVNKEKKLSEEEVIDVIEKANKDFIVYDRKFEFSIHEKTKQIMVKVIDANNDEVIRELPPEKILDMVAAMWEVAGIIIDKKI